MHVYWSMAFVLPKAIILEIEAICWKFLWSGKLDANSMAMVAWEKNCLPKCEVGIGLKQIEQWNKAAICRYVWKACTRTKSL